MALKSLPPWLAGKVWQRKTDDGYENVVTVALHQGYDIDQVGAAYFMRRFLEKLGLAVVFCFRQQPPANALCLDIGGGLFDGHESGLSATFLAAKLTGFLKAHEWVLPVVKAVSLLDEGQKFGAPFIDELRKISTFMGARYRQAKGFEKGRTIPEEAALFLGMDLFDLVLFEAETRYNAIGYVNSHPDAVQTVELGGQSRMIVFCVQDWAQTAVNAYLAQQNPRVTISVDTTNGFVCVRSRKDELNLQPVAAALRRAELEKRGKPVEGDLAVGDKLVGWFTPPGEYWMVANGTPKFPVYGEEKTFLTVAEITAIVTAAIPLCTKRVGK